MKILKLVLKIKRINFEKFSIFQALLISVGANHALNIGDIKYYSNNFYNILEPVYYDGVADSWGKYSLKDYENFTNKTQNM